MKRVACAERANWREIAEQTPNAWIPMQFDNPANVEVHRRTTAEEIARDFPDGLDYIVTGVGTGGHITGVAEVLKPRWPALTVYAVEPTLSPVLSGGTHTPHPIQGIGAGFVPGVMRPDLLDGILQVSPEDAFAYAKRAAREEGLRTLKEAAIEKVFRGLTTTTEMMRVTGK